MRFIKITIIVCCLNLICFQLIFAQSGSLKGSVVDKSTGSPVKYVYLIIKEINIYHNCGESGKFLISNLPEGLYKLSTYRFGYLQKTIDINIVDGETTEVNLRIEPNDLVINEVVKKAVIEQSSASTGFVIPEKKIRENLSVTIAETLELEPGLDKISMGPAPSRPVLRGLGGDRLLILEDGDKTGDLSATSADHAVAIDPLTSKEIKILRGPEAFIFGSNVMGGVINVKRNDFELLLNNKLSGSVQVQGESVNSGYGSAVSFNLPISDINVFTDFSYRKTDNITTPDGELQNTNINTINGSIGSRYSFDKGFFGVAAGNYKSDYGIPPDPIEGHPLGVDIELQKKHFNFEAGYLPKLELLNDINIKYQYSRYNHKEFEFSGSLGMEFKVLTNSFSGIVSLDTFGIMDEIKIGYNFEHRDYSSGGLTFTPNSKELTNGVFLFGKFEKNRFTALGTIRYDSKSITPSREYFSTRVGLIRKRSFSDFSASVSGKYEFSSTLSALLTLQRTFRAPGVEELFSEGPHLAAYSYEVGNSNLGKETGFGIEFALSYQATKLKVDAAVFSNSINNYILPLNTGERSRRRADLFLYRYNGLDALMQGYEITIKYILNQSFDFLLQVQGVNGEFTGKNGNIPRIPPVSGKFVITYKYENFSAAILTKIVADQNKTGEFETPTEGYILNNLNLSYLHSGKSISHSISFSIENLGNVKHRHHLSRIKNVMPEPGRNFKLLYKIYF